MIQECPHCLKKVMPMGDNRCPSCMKDMTDTTGIDTSKTMIILKHQQLLPAICIHCGQPTESFVDFKIQQGNSFVVELIKFVVGIILDIFVSNTGSDRTINHGEKIEIKLPVCSGCNHQHKLETEEVDFTKQVIKAKVHKDFKASIQNV